MWVGSWSLFRCSNQMFLEVRIRSVAVRRDSGHCKRQAVCAGTRQCTVYSKDASRSHGQLPTPARTNVTRRSITNLNFFFSHSDSTSSDPSACDKERLESRLDEASRDASRHWTRSRIVPKRVIYEKRFLENGPRSFFGRKGF